MKRNPKARKQLKSTKGGSLNTPVQRVTGESPGQPLAGIMEISGLKHEVDVIE